MDRLRKRKGYFVAIMATLLVTGVRYALDPYTGEQALLLPYVLAVMPAAWLGGLGPGMAATLFGAVIGVYLFVPPPFSLWIESFAHGLNATLFVAVGVTISSLCEALHAAQRRETEKQFRTLADSIPQLVWMAHADGARFWFNKRWCDYTQMPPQAAEGWGWQAVHHPSERSRVLASWRQAVARGEPWEEISSLRRYDGQFRQFLTLALPVRNARGETVCWFGTNTDITERLEVEQALKAADRRKDEFLATLAHELRNPLAPLSNVLQLWPLVKSDAAELEELRTIMERQVKQMTHLIDDLMDVSRISRGKVRLRREPVDLKVVVAQAVELNQHVVESCRHQLTIAMPDEPVIVDGDPTRLTQVFSNLLNNAAKYTGRDGNIRVTAQREAEKVVIGVCDDGPGIPPHMLTEIFEMFRQVDNTLSRAHGGLGIGLTLVKQLIELHGGTVEAKSEGAGKGSQFIVMLPALAACAKDCDSEAMPHSGVLGALPRHRVLVVDDMRESAAVLSRLLHQMGQEVSAVSDPLNVLSSMQAAPPDVVFLDLAMPGLDGLELARRIRQGGQFAETVLVALTGYSQDGIRRRAVEAGFNHYVTKPAGLEAIRQILTSLPSDYHGHETGATMCA